MAFADFNNEEWVIRAMEDGIKGHLQSALKDKFTEAAKPIIDAAIADAMKTFEASIQSYMKLENFTKVIEVVLKDKRSEQ